jgi:hypothetical protein
MATALPCFSHGFIISWAVIYFVLRLRCSAGRGNDCDVFSAGRDRNSSCYHILQAYYASLTNSEIYLGISGDFVPGQQAFHSWRGEKVRLDTTTSERVQNSSALQDVKLSPPCSVDVNITRSYTFSPPYFLMVWCEGCHFHIFGVCYYCVVRPWGLDGGNRLQGAAKIYYS